ncbi:ABC transporter permease [Hominifimenecus sp. rT4P-3]|uniref:ABC transporter permease n=1 Tax=Hominifimenecus sp. rT4P-3 TaxID=3242979 RepID=UPI003DA53A84
MSEKNQTEKQVYKKQSRAGMIWRQYKKNKLSMFSLVLILLVALVAILAPLIAPYGATEQKVADRFLGPCAAHLFGTDGLGRDIFSRILYGARISMTVGLISTSVSAFFGIILGAIAGFYGGKIDNIIMRILDVFMAIPNMLMAVVLSATLGTGIFNCMLAVGITGVPNMARVARASVMTQRNQEYIESARSNNAGNGRIIFRYVLPNALSPIFVAVASGIANAITVAASLSFIGLGIQPPNPEWGAMLAAGREYIMKYPWLCIFPGIAILITVFCLNNIGDGLRDALDPRLKN